MLSVYPYSLGWNSVKIQTALSSVTNLDQKRQAFFHSKCSSKALKSQKKLEWYKDQRIFPSIFTYHGRFDREKKTTIHGCEEGKNINTELSFSRTIFMPKLENMGA
jgi:hypothetical protein